MTAVRSSRRCQPQNTVWLRAGNADSELCSASNAVVLTETILGDARTELRRLCRHIYPSALTDSGLDEALTELVWHVPLPVELRGRAGPLPRATAATAYHVAAEALTNAAKHAGADRVDVHVVAMPSACASPSPTTVAAVPTRPGAPACGAWPTGWKRLADS